MRADQFNYDEYLKVCEEVEERAKGFRRGGFLPVTCWTLGEGIYGVNSRDREQMLKAQLDGITRTMEAKTDHLPYLEPWHGIGVFAEAFGCPFEFNDTDAPWTRTIVRDIEDLKRLEMPDIANARMLQMVLETTEYFNEQTKGRIAIAATDTQSPLNTMSLICDVDWLLLAAMDYPEEFHRVMGMITDLIIEFTKKQRALCDRPATPGHTLWSTSPVSGISLSADMMAMCGRDFYEEFSKPYDEKIGRELGGAGMHSCGKWHFNFDMVKSMKYCSIIDLAISLPWDPSPNLPEKIAEAFGGTDLPVHCRADVADIDAIDMLIRSDARMIFSLWWDDDPMVRQRNYDMVKARWETYREETV